MDRSLVQAKQGRSREDVRSIVPGIAMMEQRMVCALSDAVSVNRLAQ
jgi:hypothetical protein